MALSLGIGIVGMGWMGETHSRAWQGISERFHQAGIRAELIVCADDVEDRARDGQLRYGFTEHTADWRRVVDHDCVDVVVVTVPNNLHLEVVQAAAAAGKHIFCEKPVGRTPQETLAATSAAGDAGILSGVGYNYRCAPMVQYARQIIQDGQLGDVTHCRGRFLVDYGSDPNGARSWRFQRDIAGWGVLGDIMSHVIDMALYLVGPIRRVVARQETMITERPLVERGQGSHFSTGSGPTGPVTNEDYASAMADFDRAAVGTFEVSRVAKGHDCELVIEVNGTNGALRWNYERLNELELRLPAGKMTANGWTTIQAGPQHPTYGRFYPGPGNAMSYDDLKAIDAFRFAQSVVEERQSQPGLDEALAVAEVLDAMLRSSAAGTWTDVCRLAP